MANVSKLPVCERGVVPRQHLGHPLKTREFKFEVQLDK
jgi:hypothetical protein